VKPLDCERYLELLSLRLDGELTAGEERELEEHLSGCPACRAAEAQLAALQAAFDGLEETAAPEGFAQGVMDHIRAEEQDKKVIPLPKRPQFRALAGLAACAVLAVGLYGAFRPQQGAGEDTIQPRSFSQEAASAGTASAAAGAEDSRITAYSDEQASREGAEYSLGAAQKSTPELYAGAAAGSVSDGEVLTLDRLPEGKGTEELLILMEYSTPDEQGRFWLYVAEETLELMEQLAAEQGIQASRTPGAEGQFILVIPNGIGS